MIKYEQLANARVGQNNVGVIYCVNGYTYIVPYADMSMIEDIDDIILYGLQQS